MSGYTALDIGMEGDLLDIDTMFPKGGPRNITEEVNERSFPKIPKGKQVIPVQIAIAGKPGSGKSNLMNAMATYALTFYGADLVNIVFTDDLRVAFDLINDKPVQLFLIDDAMTNASSREIHEQKELVKAFNKRRHIFEKKLNGKPGVIITIFGWQRWKDLDPVFRDANIIFWKTGMTQKEERQIIFDMLGAYYTKILNQIWNLIDKGNNAIKSTSVVKIASLENNAGGVGIYQSALMDNVLSDLIEGEKYFGTVEENIEQLLEKLEAKPEWEKRVKCYRMHVIEGKTQKETATALDCRQGYVSESKAKIEKEARKT